MNLGIGIDTGGTFTDSVIVDLDSGCILSKAKALTTKRDLKVGVEESINGLDENLFSKVKLVSLSTTLATNSIVEGKGSRVGLIVAVPNPETFKFFTGVPADEIAVIAGAHDKNGEVTTELGIEAATNAIHRMVGEVDAFAVSGYFSIYNSEHEIKLKDIISSTCVHPVVCGYELSGHVGMVERAITAALNAKLLPVVQELLDAVKNTLDKNGINAPLMVVKGDGSLIGEEIARERPVETVLSGPAASIVGACHLTGLNDAIVADMGGTTTDIGIVRNGIVSASSEGAVVGGWQTRVQAINMWTIGLGGDSKVTIKSKEEVQIGPRKAIPLCFAGSKHPEIKRTLIELGSIKGKKLKDTDLDFFTLIKRPNFSLSKYEQMLVDALDNRVFHRHYINEEIGPFINIDRFVELGFIAEVSFTPTDLLHTRGELNLWDRDTSEAAIQFFINKTGLDRETMLDLLYNEVIESLKLNIVTKALLEDDSISYIQSGDSYKFLGYLLRLNGESSLAANLTLIRPIIAVGAPVKAYFPRVATDLDARLFIPENAEVANAVGAVTGRIIEKAEVHIRPDKPDGFVVVTFSEHKRFRSLDEAILFAEEHVRSTAIRRASQSGGTGIETMIKKEEKVAPLAAGWGDAVLVELNIIATAIGKPSF